MSLDTTRAANILERLNDEEYLANTRYQLEKLSRNVKYVDITTQLPLDEYHKLNEDIVYCPNEIWIEWESWTHSVLRIEGYCVKYESSPGDFTKKLSILCTDTHEIVEVNLNHMKGCRWGEIK